MPSSREIENQNNLLLDQRDIMEEIADLFEEAAVSGEMMVDSLTEAKDLTQEITKQEKEQEKKKKKKLTLQQKFNKLLKDAEKQTEKVEGKLKNAAKEIADTMLDALGEIGGILSSVLSLSLVGALTGILGTVISKFDFAFKGVVKELGIGFNAVGSNLNKTFMGMREDIVSMGLEFKDVIDGSRELNENFGMAMSSTAEISKDIADGAKALGVQTKTMATLVGQFQLIGDLTAEQSHNLSEHIGILAAQNDVAPQAVLEDIAQSTEAMAIFSKGGVKNFAKTAIEARKLGMSVKDVANSLKGMLNFEDSLNKELQASVMLGKNINLNEARRLAFAGDTAGAFQAIANELGDVDLGSLDPLTLQSVADAAGMSTEQLMKMSKGADEMGGVDMGAEAMTEQERAALKARETLGEMEKVLADANNLAITLASAFGGPIVDALQSFVKMLTGFDLEGAGEEFNKFAERLKKMSWEEIGAEIGRLIVVGITAAVTQLGPPLLEMFKGFGETSAGAFAKSFGLLYAAGGAGPLAGMAKALEILFVKPVQVVGNLFMKLADKVKLFGGSFDDAVGRWRNAKGQFMKTPKIIEGFTKIADRFKSISSTVSKMLGPVKAVGGGFVKFAKVFGKLGKAVPVLGQILMAVDGLFGGFKNLKEGAGFFENALRFLGGAALGIVEGILGAFTGLVDFFFGTDITSWVTGAFDKIESGFNFVVEKVIGFFSNIPQGIADLFTGIGSLIMGALEGAGDSAVKSLSVLNKALTEQTKMIKKASKDSPF